MVHLYAYPPIMKIHLTQPPNLPFLYSSLKYNYHYDPSAHLSKQLRILGVSSYEYKGVSFDERPSIVSKIKNVLQIRRYPHDPVNPVK